MNAYKVADELNEWVSPRTVQQAVNMLRQQADRIAELEKQLDLHKNAHHKCVEIMQEKQSEPVAWRSHWPSGWEYKDGKPPFKLGPKDELLYTTPQTKPLSDEEIVQLKAEISAHKKTNQLLAQKIEQLEKELSK